jgi:hypothetical protein
MSETKSFMIHNMALAQSSKLQRAMATTRHSKSLYVLGRRVLPKRPVVISIAEFEANRNELLQLLREGQIAITDPDGAFVDSTPEGNLIILKEGERAKLAMAPNLPPPPPRLEEQRPVEDVPPPPPVVEMVDEAPKAEEPVAPPVAAPRAEEPKVEDHHQDNRKKKYR